MSMDEMVDIVSCPFVEKQVERVEIKRGKKWISPHFIPVNIARHQAVDGCIPDRTSRVQMLSTGHAAATCPNLLSKHSTGTCRQDHARKPEKLVILAICKTTQSATSHLNWPKSEPLQTAVLLFSGYEPSLPSHWQVTNTHHSLRGYQSIHNVPDYCLPLG